MAIVRKFTIGVAPFAKMFRVPSLGGAAVDSVLRLRSKSLADDYFEEVGADAERKTYRVSKVDHSNTLVIGEEHIAFLKDYYSGNTAFDFQKVLSEFRILWGTLNKVLNVQDIRRIGMVAEYRYRVPGESPSAWLREKVTTLKTDRLTEKMNLRFEERELASDGTAPDPKKDDFINYIYQYYDGSLDADHPEPGTLNASLDIQRYFSPVFNGDLGDEVLKLYKHFSAAERSFDGHLRSLGASHGKE